MSYSFKKVKKGYDITLTRGDYMSFVVEMRTLDGEPYILQEGDEVYFTVKESTTTAEIILQKTGTEIEILPEETSDLDYGVYTYDIQLSPADGKDDTFIGPCKFELTDEVTWRERNGGE